MLSVRLGCAVRDLARRALQFRAVGRLMSLVAGLLLLLPSEMSECEEWPSSSSRCASVRRRTPCCFAFLALVGAKRSSCEGDAAGEPLTSKSVSGASALGV